MLLYQIPLLLRLNSIHLNTFYLILRKGMMIVAFNFFFWLGGGRCCILVCQLE